MNYFTVNEKIGNKQTVKLYMTTEKGIELFVDMCNCDCINDCQCGEALVRRNILKQIKVKSMNNDRIRINPSSFIRGIKVVKN